MLTVNMLVKFKEWFVLSPSKNHEQAFHKELCDNNNQRFSILPLFNILTQVLCYIIYLYIYPATYPNMQTLNEVFFSVFSFVYIVVNIVFCVLFFRVQRQETHINYIQKSDILILLFLVFYIISESLETVMEVEISGNIYRFLATFFVVAFLPVLPRIKKSLLLLFFVVLVEFGLEYLIVNGMATTNRYQEIILIFFFVFLIVSHITYNSAVKTFTLKQNLIEANEKLQYLTVIDPLTNIHNRRAFNDYIDHIWNESENDDTASLMMIDIDHFKSYNDNYGHQKGDEVIVAIADKIKSSFQRPADMTARYGGEEFIVLLPCTGLDYTLSMAERLRKSIEDMKIAHKQGSVVTISIGVAAAKPCPKENYEYVIKKADDALYRAKREGRNRVCLAD